MGFTELGNSLRDKCEQRGSALEDLEVAIPNHIEAVRVRPLNGIRQVEWPRNLDNALGERFEGKGRPEHLKNPILGVQETVLIQRPIQTDQARILGNLGIALGHTQI